jgi:ATPases of the AAA+ class
MLRKGRWDELFFVDLPNQSEREAIWKIQIAKYERDPKDFDCSVVESYGGSDRE